MKKLLLIGSCIALAIAGIEIQSCTKPETPQNLCFGYSPNSPVVGQPVQFSASCSTGMSDYTWDFGDGHTGSGAVVTHTYSKVGFYQVKLTANGQNGPNYQTNSFEVGYPGWNSFATNEVGYLYASFFLNKDTGFVCGVSGILQKTTNGGTSWTVLNLGTTKTLGAIFFTNSTTGFVGGPADTIYKTTDGGNTWAAQYIALPSGTGSIYFTSPNNGYIAGGTTVLSTTNGGSTWSPMTIPAGNRATNVYFSNANNGYMAGDGDTVLQTNNAGATWTKMTVGTGWGISYVYFPSVDTGYATGGGGMVFRTLNAGATWAYESTTSDYESQTSMAFINDTIGFTTGADGNLYETFDGGMSWGNSIGGVLGGVYGLSVCNHKYGFAVSAGELYTITINL